MYINNHSQIKQTTMPIIFFSLSLAMLYYAKEQPSCMYGAFIFALLGFLLMADVSKDKPTKRRRKLKI
jgi:hypothetical protein